MILPPLYHWSPTEIRVKLQQEGLKVYMPPTVGSGPERSPYICLGFTPRWAWLLSGDFSPDASEEWDLWQVEIPEKAHVEIRPEYGPQLQEVKVYTTIAPDHLWLVARREPAVFI